MTSRSAFKTLRNADICTFRLLSSTTVSGQTRLMISFFATRMPGAPISTIRRSKARLPSSTGCPSTSNRRARGNTQNRPNRMTASPVIPTSCRLVLRRARSSIGWCANCREANSCCMTPCLLYRLPKGAWRCRVDDQSVEPIQCDERLLWHSGDSYGRLNMAPREVLTQLDEGQETVSERTQSDYTLIQQVYP